MSATTIDPGTQARMRVVRRFASYNVGDVIAVPLAQGLDLNAKRLATPIDVMVPNRPAAEQPQRGPNGLIKK